MTPKRIFSLFALFLAGVPLTFIFFASRTTAQDQDVESGGTLDSLIDKLKDHPYRGHEMLNALKDPDLMVELLAKTKEMLGNPDMVQLLKNRMSEALPENGDLSQNSAIYDANKNFPLADVYATFKDDPKLLETVKSMSQEMMKPELFGNYFSSIIKRTMGENPNADEEL